jgi:spore coat protein U domain-containing protein, fimbrial subunit CupE1/2/3/6
MRVSRKLLVMAGLLTAAPLSIAAQVSTPFAVTATVVRGCAIAATDLAFGVYPAIAAPPALLATSTIRVTCALGDTYTIGLSNGANAGGGPSAQRRMARTTAPVIYLAYNLFRDAARTQNWGDTGPTRVSATGTGSAQAYTVFGQLPGGQVVSVGAYVDTVTVTVRN